MIRELGLDRELGLAGIAAGERPHGGGRTSSSARGAAKRAGGAARNGGARNGARRGRVPTRTR